VTLLALSLVMGILVDDAIVEVENIERHLRMGKTPYQAAMEAADEIGLAVIATTFALIAVFLPTAFMSGIVGKFFKQFGWTPSLAVFASLVVARLLTPMMAAYIMKPSTRVHEEPRWMPLYLRSRAGALHHRWITMFSATMAFFVGSLLLIPLMPSGFIPPDDNSQTQVYLELPPAPRWHKRARWPRRRASADWQGGACEERLHHRRRRRRGHDPFMGGASTEVRKATLTVLLARAASARASRALRVTCAPRCPNLPGVRFKVGLGGSGEKYQLVLKGEDPQALDQAAAGGGERPAHHPRPGQHLVHRQPGALRDRRAPRLCPRRRPGRDQQRHCRDTAHCHRGRLRRGPAQAQPEPAPGAHRRQAGTDACAQGPGPAGPPDGARRQGPGHAEPGGHA
jgi:hypothetical protein